MTLVVIFLFGIVNFAAHKAVLEYATTLAASVGSNRLRPPHPIPDATNDLQTDTEATLDRNPPAIALIRQALAELHTLLPKLVLS